MSAPTDSTPTSAQLSLFGPRRERWWELEHGRSRIFVVADSHAETEAKALAALRDLGVLPGGPPGLHESYLRMSAFACRPR